MAPMCPAPEIKGPSSAAPAFCRIGPSQGGTQNIPPNTRVSDTFMLTFKSQAKSTPFPLVVYRHRVDFEHFKSPPSHNRKRSQAIKRHAHTCAALPSWASFLFPDDQLWSHPQHFASPAYYLWFSSSDLAQTPN